MKKLRKAQCPYCGRKVGVFSAWLLKTQGEYRCPKCGGYSNIRQDSAVYLIAAGAVLLSALFFMIHVFFVKGTNWLSMFFVFLPFAVFYLVCPFLVRLQKPAPRHRPPQKDGYGNAQPPLQNNPGQGKDPLNMERTIVMDALQKR